jgi:tRNA nucleotidyltransferase (CCA-adding enzyme)
MSLAGDAPRVCLVGGAVRDALLGVSHGPDIDLVVEGDAIALAASVGRALGGRVVAHERFRTARIEFPHGRHVDLVSARRETYPYPGALPDVTPGSLDDDLRRRDFTVNAIAFVLHGDAAGTIIDPHGGRADIGAERIRVIRPGSFLEDPSRVVRALRYAARLAFRMEEGTEAEAREAASVVTLDQSRVADEAARLLAEASAPAGLRMGEALGLTWPDPDPLRDDRLAAIDPTLARPGAPAPTAWALRLGLGVHPGAAEAAALPQWARAIAREVRDGLALGVTLAGRTRPSEVDAILRDRAPAAQVGASIAGADVVARWWETWRDLVPEVTGSDLVAAGVAPGPAIGRALRAVRAAVLDGEARDRGEQMAMALAEAGMYR